MSAINNVSKSKRHAATKTTSQSKPKNWTRSLEDREANSAFGQKLKSLRVERKLLLSEVALATGLTGATLSRIENNKLAPTYAVVLRLLEYFNLDWADLMPAAADDHKPKFLSASIDGNEVSVGLKTARRLYPHGQNLPLPLQSLILDISAERPDEYRLFGHAGIEHCFVISGTLRFHSQDRAPIDLKKGESVLFDSRIPHAYTSATNRSVKILIVTTFREEPDYQAADPVITRSARKPSRA
jgi:transcriptional regulator with XRE-family HTH domain